MFSPLPSPTLQAGAALVALVSAILALVWARLSSPSLKWGLALGTPLVLSYSLYWLPTWQGADPFEYSTWAPIFIGSWYIAGAAAASLIMGLDALRRRRRRTDRQIGR